ncbi:MAG: hypothetical protein WD042_08115 [Phycisphaeraceae bacterium]
MSDQPSIPDPMQDAAESARPSIVQHLDQTAAYPYSRWEYLRRSAWLLVQRLLVRPSPARAYAWRAFCLRRFGATIRGGVRPSVHIMHPWLLSLGQWSMLADNVTVYNLGQITIGDHTVISQDVYLCAGTHDYTLPNLPLQRTPITIGSGVWIAAGAFIGPGVTIGDNSVVGARAVVVKDVPPGVVVAGNPARVVKNRVMKSAPVS